MKLGTLEIENFMAIGKAEIDLATRGLNLIVGVNDDDSSAKSNGAGKSSIGDAIEWCLYGTTARGASGDEVVNNVTGKNCRVAVHILDGADLYYIARHRKHTKAKNALHVMKADPEGGPDMLDLTRGTDKLTQELVVQILGCSHEVFRGAVYAAQERMPDLPGMTDKNLKVLVEEAAGTTVLEKGYRIALGKVTAAKSGLADAQTNYGAAVRMLDTAEANVEHAQADADGWAEAQVEKIAECEAVLAADELALKEAADKAAKSDPAPFERKRTTLLAKLDAVKGEREEEKRLQAALSSAERELAAAESELQASMRSLRTAMEAVKKVEHEIGCPCGECGRPITAAEVEARSALATAKRDSEALRTRDAKTRVSELVSARDSASEALEKHRASMTDVSETNEQLEKVRSALAICEKAAAEVKRTEACRDSTKTALAGFTAAENPHRKTVERMQAAVEARKGETEAASARVTEQEKALAIAESVAKVFAPSGVRAEMLDQVTPYLNAQTAKYLGTLSDGNIHATWTTLVKTKSGELKEKFAIEVANDKGGGSFALISGGEKRKVRVAAALALQDLVMSRATKDLELFIGDEIDDALDTAGLERLTMILEEKARERGTVLLISHSDIRDWIPSYIEVRKRGKVSSVSESVC